MQIQSKMLKLSWVVTLILHVLNSEEKIGKASLRTFPDIHNLDESLTSFYWTRVRSLALLFTN